MKCIKTNISKLVNINNRLYFWAVLGILVISATFFLVFSEFWARLGSCFRDFNGFSYFFWRFFRLFRWFWGAVLGISAVSATFLGIFPAVSLWLGELFWGFQWFQLLFYGFFWQFFLLSTYGYCTLW